MSLVFAAFTPHPPLLIPTIGKDAIKKVQKTKLALEQLEEDLYATEPELIVIISPHGSFFNESFTINHAPEYETDLREFGDLVTRLKFKSDDALTSRLQTAAGQAGFPVSVISEPKIDHGAAVPLYYLTAHLPGIAILPLGFCGADWKTHLDFGYLLKEEIMKSGKRIAVIASGDLSHALLTEAPAGFNKAGPEFDAKIQELLSSRNTTGLLQLNPKFVSEAAECGFRSLLMLLGVLMRMEFTYKQYSYEGPFGVGYLTANFVI